MLKNNFTNLGLIKCYKVAEKVVNIEPKKEKPDKNSLEKPCKKAVKPTILYC